MTHLHNPASLSMKPGVIQAKYHTSHQARTIIHSFISFSTSTFDPEDWFARPQLISQPDTSQSFETLTWQVSISHMPFPLQKHLQHLPGNLHATLQPTPPLAQRESLSCKRFRPNFPLGRLYETPCNTNETLLAPTFVPPRPRNAMPTQHGAMHNSTHAPRARVRTPNAATCNTNSQTHDANARKRVRPHLRRRRSSDRFASHPSPCFT